MVANALSPRRFRRQPPTSNPAGKFLENRSPVVFRGHKKAARLVRSDRFGDNTCCLNEEESGAEVRSVEGDVPWEERR